MANVTGTSNTAVTWSVNGTAGGAPATGVIDANGLYTAPADLPNPATITVTATSQDDNSKSNSVTVTVTSDVAVTTSTNPLGTLAVPTGASLGVSASIASQGLPDQRISWSVNGIANGNSTVGTISSTGLGTASYQAPVSVPTPFTVSITATSMADPSKSASLPMTVAGTINSVTQNVSAASGGTIALPDGSGVTIAPGILPFDQSLTLSEVSYLPNQPPNTAITNVGPALILSFASSIQFSVKPRANAAMRAGTSPLVHSNNTSSAPSAFQFLVNTHSNNVALLNGSMPTANFVDALGSNTFTGVDGNYDSTVTLVTGTVRTDLLTGFANSVISQIQFAAMNFTNLFAVKRPFFGGLLLGQDSVWRQLPTVSSSDCPTSRGLILVHGMGSTVEQTFPPIDTQKIQMAGGTSVYYDRSFGFDYDWVQSIVASGTALTGFLDNLAASCPSVSWDVEAHSEGVPVSMSALAQTKNKKIEHFVSLGGPIMGTPVANDIRILQALILATPDIPLPIYIADLATLFSSPFVTDLQVGSSALAQIRSNLSPLSNADAPQVITVGGTVPRVRGIGDSWGIPLIGTPNFDGFIPLSSSLAFDSGLKVYPRFVSVGHNEYISDPFTTTFVGNEVRTTPALELVCQQPQNCDGPRQNTFAFTGEAFGPDPTLISAYTQDSAGGVAPLSTPGLVDTGGNVDWLMPGCSESPGRHAIFAFNGILASSRVMQSVDAGICAIGAAGTIQTVVSGPLQLPSGIAFDPKGNMFIADSGKNVIHRLDAITHSLTTIAGTGLPGFSGDNGPATSAQLNDPTHVVFDRSGNLYITDALNERIRRVDTNTGIITTVAGNGVAGFSGDGGPATSAELNFPDGVGLDASDNVYIGDALNNRIRKLDVATGFITTVAGNGIQGFSGDGGLATNAELNFPSRPALDGAGNMYIADFQNNRIRRVDATTHVIVTIAGTGIAAFSGDGQVARNADLNGPISVTVDTSGNLYIGDINNSRIRVVNTGLSTITVAGQNIEPGTILTIAGNGIVGYQGDGGAATSAELNFPTGLLLDPAGNLYFADAKNNVIRVVSLQ